MRIAFVTNLCTHYTAGLFELLARRHDLDFYFFSAGSEWYWPKEHGYRRGEFHSQYLAGFHIGRTRVTPLLPWKLLRNNYDIYIKCINGRFALPVTYLIARLRRKPFILWTGVWCRLATPLQRLIFPLTRMIYRRSDAIVVYGEHVKRYLIDEGVIPDRIFVAKHATDNQFYGRTVPKGSKDALRASLGLSSNERIILYLGRLEPIKGLTYLLEAFGRLGDNTAVLVFAGDGIERASLEALARQMPNANRIRFAGYVPIELAPVYHSLAWVFVLPSVTVKTGKETWGLVVNEAFNQGVPVIATEAVGAAAGGLVMNNLNGLVVPERNAEALTGALRRVLEEPGLRDRLGANARETIDDWDYVNGVVGYDDAIRYVSAHGDYHAANP